MARKMFGLEVSYIDLKWPAPLLLSLTKEKGLYIYINDHDDETS